MGKRNDEPRGTGFDPPAPSPSPGSPAAPEARASSRETGAPRRPPGARGALLLRVSHDLWQTVGLLGGGGALMLAGAMLVVIAGTWWRGSVVWVAGLVLVATGLAFTVAGMSVVRAEAARCSDPKIESQGLYQRFLVGLGFLLFAVSMLAVVGFAGMLHTNQIPASGAAFKARLVGDATTGGGGGGPMLAVMLLVSGALSVVGATFFVTASMREHQANNARDGSEAFSESRFWGGLWFRLGQAVLYTLVFFIVLWAGLPGAGASAALSDSMIVLPVVGLLIGMFVKAGEALVAGIAERILGAVTALVGPPKK